MMMGEKGEREVRQENEEVHRPGSLFFAPSFPWQQQPQQQHQEQQQSDMKVAESIYKRSARHKEEAKTDTVILLKCGLVLAMPL